MGGAVPATARPNPGPLSLALQQGSPAEIHATQLHLNSLVYLDLGVGETPVWSL